MNTVEHDLARSAMWAKLIPGYAKADKNKKKKLKLEYSQQKGVKPCEVNMEIKSNITGWFMDSNYDSIPIMYTTSYLDTFTVSNTNTTMEDDMSFDTPAVDAAKTYLTRQLSDLRYDKRRELEKHFGIYGFAPASLKEM